MVIPDTPTKPWFGALMRDAREVITLARKGDREVFLQPSRNYNSSVGRVPWDVFAVRFDFSGAEEKL